MEMDFSFNFNLTVNKATNIQQLLVKKWPGHNDTLKLEKWTLNELFNEAETCLYLFSG